MKCILLFFLISLSVVSYSQDTYKDCGMNGNAPQGTAKAITNRSKNRYTFPTAKDIDKKITASVLLASTDGKNEDKRFDTTKAATITAYCSDVKVGGSKGESCNCKMTDRDDIDTHIELTLEPMNGGTPETIIVEVTPRIRAIMKAKGIDWSTKALRQQFMGRWVRVTGWLFYDYDHVSQALNTAPNNPKCWRRSCWEIHPITSIEVTNRNR